jgi:hypothetical protein
VAAAGAEAPARRVAPSGATAPMDSTSGDAGGGGGTGARGTAAAAPATVAGAGEPGAGEPAGVGTEAGAEGEPEDDDGTRAGTASEGAADAGVETVPIGFGSGRLPGACPGEGAPDAGTTAGVWAPDTAPAAV